MDPVEIRRKNLVAKFDTPHTTCVGQTYDCGDYEGSLDRALAAAGYDDLRAEQQRRIDAGDTRLLGIGVSVFLLAAGAKDKRYSLPNSKIMIHQVLGGARGQATDIEIHARDILRTKDQMNRILAERTGQPLEKIQRDTERDYFLTADEAKEYGVIDTVLEYRKLSAQTA